MECDKTNTTLSSLFECAIINEMKAADIFASFSDAFSFHDGLKNFWDDMQKDEIMHAEVLRTIHNDLPETRLAEKPDDNVCKYAEKAYQLINSITNEKPKNLDEAYELAHELEFCELNEVYLILLDCKIGSKKAKQFIKDEIKKHQSKMVNFKETFGDKSWRKTILPKYND